MLPVLQDEPVQDLGENGATWRRSGNCNRCGECCCSGDPFNGELGPPKVEGACPLFARDHENLGTCAVRGEESSVLLDAASLVAGRHYNEIACLPWPSHPRHIESYPNCSYKFERVR